MKTYKRYIATIIKDPKTIYDTYSHKKMLYFLMGFTDKDGIYKSFNVVAVNDGNYPIYDLFKKWASKGDIWDITGYITRVKALGYKKPITAIRKFTNKWNNNHLLALAREHIKLWETLEHGTYKSRKDLVNKTFKGSPEYKEFFKLKHIKVNKKDRDSYYYHSLRFNKMMAKTYYKDGDKYNALALLIQNRYIVSKYISDKYINNNINEVAKMLTLKEIDSPHPIDTTNT